ncbi:MAG: sigma-54-dependent Fis family transcriptional regulator [Deltaproteobacteria bacterium]|nr:sigma-54-dependent Fis family transcriptional regulator [Deltaproteobacteria bacterium]
MTKILVVDDEKDIRDSLEGVLCDEGYEVMLASDAGEAMERIKLAPDLVLLDIWMSGKDGIEVLKEIKARFKNLPVIMISGHGTIETAVKTTKIGAYDFIEKPLSLDKVMLTIEHALEQKRLVEENMAFKQGVLSGYEIIGQSKVMEALKTDILRAAPANSWVLITGENGTGKEFVARNIHLHSVRAARPFVEVNSAAIPEELIESELFGHEKGAFTGAVAQRKGKFDMADRGTIFLDEIGDMSLKTQAKILRILQEKSFERVGGQTKITVDVRVIAATNKDLTDEIKKGNFREDLYYRLNVIPLHVPPLRERREDIPFFVEHFLGEYSREAAKNPPSMTDGATALLTGYNWPGNVRELRNLIERLVIMTPSGIIKEQDLPDHIRGESVESQVPAFDKGTLKEARSDFEKEFILRKLEENGWNIAKTAESIGIERSHLYRKIKGYGIEG